MWIAYLDEAGCTGTLPSSTSEVQPVFAEAAVFLPSAQLATVTASYLDIKRKFFPGLIPGGQQLDAVLAEVKGSRVRAQIRGSRNERRHAVGFLDKILDLLEFAEARFVARVWVKAIGADNNARSMYTFSMQDIHSHFQHFLSSKEGLGFFVADSRRKAENANATHSIFTQKFGLRGDRYSRILEAPTYGHSENHVGLQLADHLCSALLFPIACFVYCTGHVTNIHVHPAFEEIGARYGERLRSMAYCYTRLDRRRRRERMVGGVTVSDGLNKRPSHLIYCGPGSGVRGPGDTGP